MHYLERHSAVASEALPEEVR